MYDPARDAFVAADEPTTAQPPTNPPSSSPGNKRKRSASVDDTSAETPAAQAVTEPIHTGEVAEEPSNKKLKPSPPQPSKNEEKPTAPVTSISQLPRMKKAPGAARNASRRPERSPYDRRRSRSPARQDDRRARRTPPRRRSPSPAPIRRSPTPPGRSPPRQRKRPGAGARINIDKDTVNQRQQEREQQQNEKAKTEAKDRGVHDFVKQHYNAVPQRGKEWRKTESNIRGLRSFNNWIKSAVIQKFSPAPSYAPGAREKGQREQDRGLLVLDMGCGKGGDLQKWHACPQGVELYVGLDPADVSIDQARDRFLEMQRNPRRGPRERFPPPLFHGEFVVKDCFGEWIGDIPIIQQVGIDPSVGPNAGGMSARFGGGGFDVVTMMFSMHYAFENEVKARGMLRNVAGALKKGGRFIGVVPNSDVLSAKVIEYNNERAKSKAANDTATATGGDADEDEWDPEKTLDAPAPVVTDPDDQHSDATADPLEWGNKIYKVKFPGRVPHDGIFRPPFGWKYFFFLEEAVEEVPEYVVPWEAFRALAADYDLELQYRKPFEEIYDHEKNDPILGPLSEKMGVRQRRDAFGNEGGMLMNNEELEAASFYHAFCFYKV